MDHAEDLIRQQDKASQRCCCQEKGQGTYAQTGLGHFFFPTCNSSKWPHLNDEQQNNTSTEECESVHTAFAIISTTGH